jgi:hypothetical protein
MRAIGSLDRVDAEGVFFLGVFFLGATPSHTEELLSNQIANEDCNEIELNAFVILFEDLKEHPRRFRQFVLSI